MTSVIIVEVQNHAYQIHEHVARTAQTNKKLDRKVRCKSWTMHIVKRHVLILRKKALGTDQHRWAKDLSDSFYWH